MKGRTWILALALLAALGLSACSVQVRTPRGIGKEKPLPPGQAKKITGSQSARDYAPGHRK